MVDPASLVVVLLVASDEEIIRRLAARRICDNCAITQSIQDDTEDRDGCPYCGGNLSRRPDDHPDTVRRRLVDVCGVRDAGDRFLPARADLRARSTACSAPDRGHRRICARTSIATRAV